MPKPRYPRRGEQRRRLEEPKGKRSQTQIRQRNLSTKHEQADRNEGKAEDAGKDCSRQAHWRKSLSTTDGTDDRKREKERKEGKMTGRGMRRSENGRMSRR